MNNEKMILENMFAANKISKDDYLLLLNTLDTKLSSVDTYVSFLINPFQKVAGIRALIAGICIVLAMSFLGIIANVYFEGVLGCTFALSFKNAKINPNFLFLFYENIVACFSLTLFFLATAKIFKQKRIRIIDFFGTVTLARFPYLILVASEAALQVIKPALFDFDPAKNFEFHFSFILFMSNIFWTFCYMWQIATYFYALKESSGLTGKKLWISFLISIIFCEMLGLYLTRIFL